MMILIDLFKLPNNNLVNFKINDSLVFSYKFHENGFPLKYFKIEIENNLIKRIYSFDLYHQHKKYIYEYVYGRILNCPSLIKIIKYDDSKNISSIYHFSYTYDEVCIGKFKNNESVKYYKYTFSNNKVNLYSVYNRNFKPIKQLEYLRQECNNKIVIIDKINNIKKYLFLENDNITKNENVELDKLLKYHYEYVIKNNLLLKTSEYDENKHLVQFHNYKYLDDKLIKHTIYDLNGRKHLTYKFVYSKYNNLVRIIRYYN